MEAIIRSAGRTPKQRSTAYGEVSEVQTARSFGAKTLIEPTYTSARKYDRANKRDKAELVRPGLLDDGEKITSADII